MDSSYSIPQERYNIFELTYPFTYAKDNTLIPSSLIPRRCVDAVLKGLAEGGATCVD